MNNHTVRFIVIASILYGVFHFAYHKIPDDYLRNTIYPNVIGYLAADIIHLISPEKRVRVQNNSIIAKGVKLNIVRGCDGSGVLFMLTAAILGFGASLRHTLVGLVLGGLTVYIINQIRIVGLFYVVDYNRDWFQPVHTYYAPTLIIFLVSLFFLVWCRWATADYLSASPHNKEETANDQ